MIGEVLLAGGQFTGLDQFSEEGEGNPVARTREEGFGIPDVLERLGRSHDARVVDLGGLFRIGGIEMADEHFALQAGDPRVECPHTAILPSLIDQWA
jgi:hypothetical protein